MFLLFESAQTLLTQSIWRRFAMHELRGASIGCLVSNTGTRATISAPITQTQIAAIRVSSLNAVELKHGLGQVLRPLPSLKVRLTLRAVPFQFLAADAQVTGLLALARCRNRLDRSLSARNIASNMRQSIC